MKIIRINVGTVRFCKPLICSKFTFLHVETFCFIWLNLQPCDNVVLRLWLGLGAEATWLGLEQDHVLA